jgi:hypothetical protein
MLAESVCSDGWCRPLAWDKETEHKQVTDFHVSSAAGFLKLWYASHCSSVVHWISKEKLKTKNINK